MRFSYMATVASIGIVGALSACAMGSSVDANNNETATSDTSTVKNWNEHIPSSPHDLAHEDPIGEASRGSAGMACVDGNVLFHCETRNNKEIILCDNGENIDYSFGKVNQSPELSLSVPRDQATTFQWKGLGRWINYSVTIPNGPTRYTVFTSADRIGHDHEFESGVIATTDGGEIARILCNDPIIHNLEGVDLRADE